VTCENPTWLTNRWLPPRPPRQERDAQGRVLFDDPGSCWLDTWGTPPRTCAYCGGAHPDDVLALMRAGWEDEIADRRHKGYLEPPGSRAEMVARLKAKAFPKAAGESFHPSPPLKFYVVHFSSEQLADLNRLHKECQARIPAIPVIHPPDCGGRSG